MERTEISLTHLAGLAALVGLGVLFDASVLIDHPIDSIEIILVADVSIFAGLAFDLVFRSRRRKVQVQEAAISEKTDGSGAGLPWPEAGPAGAPTEESPKEAPDPESLRQSRVALHPGIDTEIESEAYMMEKPMPASPGPSRQELLIHSSPIELKTPAFICGCGHQHRFVCLACGTTIEKVYKKKGTKWVEWQPGMEPIP